MIDFSCLHATPKFLSRTDDDETPSLTIPVFSSRNTFLTGTTKQGSRRSKAIPSISAGGSVEHGRSWKSHRGRQTGIKRSTHAEQEWSVGRRCRSDHFDKPGITGVGLGNVREELCRSSPWRDRWSDPVCGWWVSDCCRNLEISPPPKPIPTMKRQRTRHARRDGTLKGILWYQGESDCKPDLAMVYEQNCIV